MEILLPSRQLKWEPQRKLSSFHHHPQLPRSSKNPVGQFVSGYFWVFPTRSINSPFVDPPLSGTGSMWFMELLGAALAARNCPFSCEECKALLSFQKRGEVAWRKMGPTMASDQCYYPWHFLECGSRFFFWCPPPHLLPNGPAYLKAGTEPGQSGQKLLRLH